MKVKQECSKNWMCLKAELEKQKKDVKRDNGKNGSKPNLKRKHVLKASSSKRRKTLENFSQKESSNSNKEIKSQDIWFDDITFDEILEAEGGNECFQKKFVSNQKPKNEAEKKLVKTSAFSGLTKVSFDQYDLVDCFDHKIADCIDNIIKRKLNC